MLFSVTAITYKLLLQSARKFLAYPPKTEERTLKAKNKYLTRQVLNEKLLSNIASQLLYSGSAPALDFPFPVVAKPKEGVASIDVQRCNSQSELESYCEHFTANTRQTQS